MSKYIVIYSWSYNHTEKKLDAPNPYFIQEWRDRIVTESGISIEPFDDYQEAYLFATKKNGFVLKPVEPMPISEQP